MRRSAIIVPILFIVHLFFQVLVLKNVVLFHTAFCFLHVSFLLLLPIEMGSLALLGLGFLMGFSIDVFYDSLGLHALSCVLMIYLRNFWIARITPLGGYETGSVPSINLGGITWFLMYAMPLIFIHHTVLFFTEVGGFHLFWITLRKALASTLFTTFVIVLLQYIFPDRA
ncbi:MAG: Rod shape-determining protein MreD [Flammeovirgaceae bacterium]|nr:Rod shape-determining protein MreD [Flammeovirgaceae bacterium]